MAREIDPIDEEADNDEAPRGLDKAVRDLEARVANKPTDEVEIEDEPDEEVDEAPAESRKDRRNARMSARERAAAAEARAATLQEQLDRAQRAPATPAPQQQQSALVGVDRNLRNLYAEQERISNEYQTKKTISPDEETSFRDKAMELRVREGELIAEREAIRNAPRRAQEQLSQRLAAENPEVYGNPRARQYAHGYATQQIARGRADDAALHAEAMEVTKQEFLKIRPPPDAATKARFAGVSSRSVPAASAAPTKIAMPQGSALYKQACALYPTLSPAAACQKWANGPGKKLVAMRG